MLPKESRELPRRWIEGLVRKTLFPHGAIQARPLKTNNYQRHKNWKITIRRISPRAKSSEAQRRAKEEKISYLLRIENPFTNKVRKMFLKDEIAVLRHLQPYRVAPKLIAHGRYKGRLFLIEEWMRAKPFSLPSRPARKDFKKIVAFIARMNRIPLSRVSKGIRFKNDRLDHLVKRKRELDARIRAGRAIKEFRPLIKAIMPIYKEGFAELTRRVRALPKSVWRRPVLSYRDISRDNIFMAQPHYLAVDWEWHSTGIADPSLSLVVLMQRLRLLRYRAQITSIYRRLRPTPHLEELIDARILERLLGGLTWSLGWIANMKRVGVPANVLRHAIRGGIQSTREHARELERFLRATSTRET